MQGPGEIKIKEVGIKEDHDAKIERDWMEDEVQGCVARKRWWKYIYSHNYSNHGEGVNTIWEMKNEDGKSIRKLI